MPAKDDTTKSPPPPPPPTCLPTHTSLPTKIKCPKSTCGRDLYYYPPTRVNNVRTPITLSCASCKHVFPPPLAEPPTEALSSLSITLTHYEILGVEKTASPDEIARAYRKKSLQCHPDRTQGREKEWDQLTKAYEILGDKRKRHWYDVELDKGVSNPDESEDPASQGSSPLKNACGLTLFYSQNRSRKVFPGHFWRRAIL